jgi:hypothetical protein
LWLAGLFALQLLLFNKLKAVTLEDIHVLADHLQQQQQQQLTLVLANKFSSPDHGEQGGESRCPLVWQTTLHDPHCFYVVIVLKAACSVYCGATTQGM